MEKRDQPEGNVIAVVPLPVFEPRFETGNPVVRSVATTLINAEAAMVSPVVPAVALLLLPRVCTSKVVALLVIGATKRADAIIAALITVVLLVMAIPHLLMIGFISVAEQFRTVYLTEFLSYRMLLSQKL